MSEPSMDNIEEDIKRLPWRKLPGRLETRIFSNHSEPSHEDLPGEGNPRRRLTVVGALALATAAGLVGFLLGTQFPVATNEPVVASVVADIRIVETPVAHNSFDFSADSTQILPGEFVVYFEDDQETEE